MATALTIRDNQDRLTALDHDFLAAQQDIEQLCEDLLNAPRHNDSAGRGAELLEALRRCVDARDMIVAKISMLTRVAHITKLMFAATPQSQESTAPPLPHQLGLVPEIHASEEVLTDEEKEEEEEETHTSIPGISSSSLHVRELLRNAVREREACEHLYRAVQMFELPGDPPNASSIVWRAEERSRMKSLLDAAAEVLPELPQELQIGFCEMLQARVRAYQEICPHDQGTAVIHQRMRAHLDREEPGYAHGFAHKHQPQHGVSWYEDVRYLQTSLIEALMGSPKATRSGSAEAHVVCCPSGSQSLADEEGADESSEGCVDEDWAGYTITRGRRAVVYGGSPRPEQCARFKRDFDFVQVQWIEDSDANSRGVASRLEHGHIDIAITTRFATHGQTERIRQAARDAGAFFVRLPNGYGAGALRYEIEQKVRRGS